MLAITMQCEVPPERRITVQLPEQIEPGTHELILVCERMASRRTVSGNDRDLMTVFGSVPSLADVDGVAWQRALRDEWA